jgi:hypothetical protein
MPDADNYTQGTLKEISEAFLDFERDLNLLSREVAGVRFWERLRFPLHRSLLNPDETDVTDAGDHGIRMYLSGVSLFLRNVVVKNPFLSGDPELLFYGTGRRKKTDGEYADVVIDPILGDLQWRSLCLERPYKISHMRPAATENLKYTDLIEYAGTIAETLGIGTVSLTDTERSMLNHIADEFGARFGRRPPLPAAVQSDLSKRRIRLALYKRLLNRLDPKLALLVNSYFGRETFVEACQSSGVPVAELQHGAITNYHMGYSFPNNDKSVFPDYFFTYGEFWSEEVEFPIPEENVYVVGYPHMEQTYAQYADCQTSEQIVVVSQPSVGEDLSQLAATLSERVSLSDHLVYKLHPKEYDDWRERYPWLTDSGIEIVSEEPSLHQLFAESTAQIGVHSTALYEGLRFDLDTYLFECPGIDHMEYLVSNGYAETFSSGEEFSMLHGATDLFSERANSEHFFASDSVERFSSAVDDIIG